MITLASTLRAPETVLLASVTAVVLGFILLLISSRSRSRLGNPVASFVLIALGFTALFVGAAAQDEPPVWNGEGHQARRNVPPALRDLDSPAFTDRGNAIVQRVPTGRDGDATIEAEGEYLTSSGLSLELTRTGKPTLETNCHGWVFTGGTAWIAGVDVPLILKDNGYELVCVPAAGDIIVYRDDSQQVLHTGMVRSITPEGAVLVESKFGQLSRFLHEPESQAYSRNWQYYRSPRDGHVLCGASRQPETVPAGPAI